MKSGDIVAFSLFGSLLFVVLAFFLILFLLKAKSKQRKFKEEKKQIEHLYEQQLLKSQLEIQEQSFKHFSEEIHDNVGQLLSLTSMQLHQLEGSPLSIEKQEKLTQCQQLLNTAISDLRSISHTLNANLIAKIGLIDSLKKEVQYVNATKKVNCDLQILGEPFINNKEVELIAFRIVQQAVLNAIKHGSPTQIQIILNYETSDYQLTVTDNGKGFEINEHNANGIGLINMQARAELIGKDFMIDSQPQKGTTITFKVNKKTNV